MSRISQALAELDLPSAIARRLGRALDGYFRRAGTDSSTLRYAARDAAAVMMAREANPTRALRRLEDAIAAHGEERGYRGHSLLAQVPRSQLLAAEITSWAAAALHVPPPGGDELRPSTRTIRWQEHARRARGADRQPV